MHMLWVVLFVLLITAPLYAVTVTTEPAGQIEFVSDMNLYTTLTAGTFGPGWEWSSQASSTDSRDLTSTATHRQLTATFPIAGTAATVTMNEDVVRVDADTLQLQYDFTVNQTAAFSSLFVSCYLPCSRYADKIIRAYDSNDTLLQSVTLPTTLGSAQLFWQDNVARLEVARGSEDGYTLYFTPAAPILLQDNRQWGSLEYEIRIECLGTLTGQSIPAGSQFSRPLTIDFPTPLDYQLDPDTAVSQNDTSGWVPYVLPWDNSPIDLSWLNDKPAGSHGFLQVRDGRFAFADGTPVRFWGTCNSAAANFPTHEQSDLIAARLAKFGVNMIRTHHADAGWSNPNFFDESYGDTQHFDVDALDRFDYFVSALKQHGVYVYLDQLVHRKFTTGDGVVNADQLDYAAKPYTLFDPTLIALQKQFSHDLWTHVNPYTGLAYKDDPAIALMEFTNENDLFTADVTVEPYATHFEDLWREWATTHGINPDQPVREVNERSSEVLRFIDELQKQYYADMYAYLRSIGVQVPITGNTWFVVGANLPSQATMDYLDGHTYWDHPYDDYQRFHNRKMVMTNATLEGNNLSMLAASRVHGKPFVVSEWGHPWPNEWRAEGALPIAAVGSFQGWDGILAYTYRHSTATPVETLSGAFETFNDPAVFGLFPTASLLFRRGDVATGMSTTAVVWQDAQLFASPALWTWSPPDAYRPLVEMTRLVTALVTPTGVAQVVLPSDRPATSGATWVDSDNNQLRRDWSRGFGRINAPCTQGVYGNVGGDEAIATQDAVFSITTPFASVVLTSLDGENLNASKYLLLTAVGRAENTGMQYNVTHTRLQTSGTAPILIEPISGQVVLLNTNRHFWIRAVHPDGTRTILVEKRLASDEQLTVTLSPSAETIYYEIVAPGRFDDVPFDYWAAHQIEACVAQEVVEGYPDNTYRPLLPVTRAQLAVYIARALAGGESLVPTGPATPTFSDVPTDFWAYQHIEYAVTRQVVEGYDDHTYRPALNLNRAQMAVFLARALTGSDNLVPSGPLTPSFTDVALDFWAYKHIEFIKDSGVAQGYSDGTYRPLELCKRDQMAVFVARAFSFL